MKGIFLDLETTGLDPTHHCPIDLALKVVDLTTGKTLDQYQSLIRPTSADWEKRDLRSLAVNGYKWEQVELGKEPFAVAQEIIGLLSRLEIVRGKGVFICQNPVFDRGFFIQLIPVYTQEKLNWPYHWLDLASMYWTIIVNQAEQEGIKLPEQISFSKNSIANHYDILPELFPHQAMGGVNHLIRCYEAMLGFH
jgi:oligoribonuclease